MTVQDKNRFNLVGAILIFIIAPFLAFICSILRIKNLRNLWTVFFFYLLFGLCFTINQQSGFDSLRYVEQFQSIATGNLREIFITNIMVDGSIGDVYFPIVMWIAHKLGGNNYHIMFLLFALVFASFTIKSIAIYFHNRGTSKWWVFSILVTILILNNFIFNINGMRFWTAAWILTYAMLSYYVENRKTGLIWLLITPLVHSTFVFPIFIFLITKFFGEKEKLWIATLIISIPFSFLSLKLIPFASSVLPDAYMGKFEFYTEEHYIQARSSGIGFTYLEDFMRTCMMILEVYVLYKIYKNKHHDNNWTLRTMFHYTIVFIGLSNFLSAIPSMGRFIIVGVPMVVFFIWINTNKPLYRQYLILFLGTMSFSIMNLILNRVVLVLPQNFYYSNLISLVSRYI